MIQSELKNFTQDRQHNANAEIQQTARDTRETATTFRKSSNESHKVQLTNI
jgi:hypothetical protein